MKGGERMADMHSAVAAIRLLGTLSGQEFDRAYVAELVMDHATAIGTFEAAEKDLENNDLQKFAHDTLPTLRTHHHHAKSSPRRSVRLPRWMPTGVFAVSLNVCLHTQLFPDAVESRWRICCGIDDQGIAGSKRCVKIR
jgi:hypothetical protein